MLKRSKLPKSWTRLERERQRGRAASRRMRVVVHRTRTKLPPAESAKAAGLRYVNDETMPGIRRHGRPGRLRKSRQ